MSLRSHVKRTIREVETSLIKRALSETNGNKSQAARLLEIDYKTLYCKIKMYGLET